MAVSGGVDSVVLLDLLSKLSGVGLIVAHFNHGIRSDSVQDEELVKELAHKYGLPFEVGYGRLGPGVSEDTARSARYAFLEAVKQKYQAKAIITAHHQDDVIETALLNVLRGTGRQGLTAILDNPKIVRPLTGVPKKEVIKYALSKHLRWRDDNTNVDPKYLRNYIRQNVTSKLTDEQKKSITSNIDKVAKNNKTMDQLIATFSQYIKINDNIDRQRFINLPTEVCNELVVNWLRGYKVIDIDKKTIERLNMAIKTAVAGTKHPVKKDLMLNVGVKSAHFSNTV